MQYGSHPKQIVGPVQQRAGWLGVSPSTTLVRGLHPTKLGTFTLTLFIPLIKVSTKEAGIKSNGDPLGEQEEGMYCTFLLTSKRKGLLYFPTLTEKIYVRQCIQNESCMNHVLIFALQICFFPSNSYSTDGLTH